MAITAINVAPATIRTGQGDLTAGCEGTVLGRAAGSVVWGTKEGPAPLLLSADGAVVSSVGGAEVWLSSYSGPSIPNCDRA